MLPNLKLRLRYLSSLRAGGLQESRLKKNMTNLGAVHISFEPTYFVGGIEYDTFDRSYRRELDTIARGNNVNLIHVEGGVDAIEPRYAVQELLDLGVDGIVIFEQEPGMAPGLVEMVKASGVSVIVHGMQPEQPLQVPYVSFDEYGSCQDLGKAVAQRFLQQFPGETARVLILNSRSAQTDVAREDGFTAGFRSVVPSAPFLNGAQDTGTFESAADITTAVLAQKPLINVVFATSDLRAEGALAALNNTFAPGDRARSVILAGVGGSAESMGQLLNPDSPWKAAAVPLLQRSLSRPDIPASS